jgi:copper homeostasis protein
MLLEICANSVQSAIHAQLGGADRIELCRDLSVGGVTPSGQELKEAREQIDIPVFVLVRARGGDFVYSQAEVEEMTDGILLCKSLGYEGVVIGALTESHAVDIATMQKWVEAADGMSVTFHRAFDELSNPFDALDLLRKLGVSRILTAGLAGNAVAGLETLKALVQQAGSKLVIMPGGGVRPDNIEVLLQTKAREFHSSCIPSDEMLTSVEMVQSLRGKLLESKTQ